MPLPRPAPRSTSTLLPTRRNSSAPTGKSATRYSCDLISFGTPTIMILILAPRAKSANFTRFGAFSGLARQVVGRVYMWVQCRTRAPVFDRRLLAHRLRVCAQGRGQLHIVRPKAHHHRRKE